MNIAFDIRGTLRGRNQIIVRTLFKWFAEEKGASMTVWTNGMLSDARDVVRELSKAGLDAEPDNKYSRSEAQEQGLPLFDIAVEDESDQAEYLAAKAFILVHEIPDDPGQFEAKYGHFFNGVSA